MGNLSGHFDVQEFVPKQVYDVYGLQSKQFVSNGLVIMAEAIHKFWSDKFIGKEYNGKKVKNISVLINNWHIGGTFNWRGLRTVDYINEQLNKGIKTAKLSQHIGGSANAADHNIILKFEDNTAIVLPSDFVFDTIIENEKYFLEAGLTTLENKKMTQGWTHADCRYTGLEKIFIVNPN